MNDFVVEKLADFELEALRLDYEALRNKERLARWRCKAKQYRVAVAAGFAPCLPLEVMQ